MDLLRQGHRIRLSFDLAGLSNLDFEFRQLRDCSARQSEILRISFQPYGFVTEVLGSCERRSRTREWIEDDAFSHR